MTTPKIKVTEQIIPMIYAYTTPGIPDHKGWTKIGYTAKQSVEARITQQTHTADIQTKLEWQDNATYKDGSGENFTDHEFHDYLTTKRHIERKPKTEWFKVNGDTSHKYFYKFAAKDYSDLQNKIGSQGMQYILRDEQSDAVKKTSDYFANHGESSEFLWNTKPRFGKTLTTYDLVRQMNLRNVLIVTNRPSVANSWYDDFEKFIDWQTDYYFVSENDALKGKGALSRQEFLTEIEHVDKDVSQIVFESLQSLKGSEYFGGNYDKLKWIADINWDLLVIDEAHEGVDTYKTDRAFDKIKTKYTLHLSGTPFKAIANGKFADNQIYNWSYTDEQAAKEKWDEELNRGNDKEGSNPYDVMPQLNMFAYQMSQIMIDKAQRGVNLGDEEIADPAFDLNEFFKAKGNGEFIHDAEVDHFLDALTKQNKFPFSTPELRHELKHTFWLLNRVDSAKALAKKLKAHPVFGEYDIILAAGDGKLDDEEENQKSFDKVQDAIKKYDKTITLSVGQLTTGVTIKEWNGIMMLSSMKSSAEYMQTAFRAQNPCTFNENGHLYQKENAYVFDFDPTRTLTIFDEFANNLLLETSDGKGTAQQHKQNIRKLLNFFPVIGEDENGEMVALNAEQVMSIPRHLKSQEVVRHGFMSNYLFSNIPAIFNAPAEVREILNNLPRAKEEPAKKRENTIDNALEIPINENGDIEISKEQIIGKSKELFGNKIFDDIEFPNTFVKDGSAEKYIAKIEQTVTSQVTQPVVNKVSESYNLSPKEANQLKTYKHKEFKATLDKHADEFNTQKRIIDTEFQKKINDVETPEEKYQVGKNYSAQLEQAKRDFTTSVEQDIKKQIQNTPTEIIERVEQYKEEQKERDVEDDVRSHLRGFSRTIPSFLMAYGDGNLNLQNFDDYVDADVFKDVTSITIKQFQFLRDGGDYQDSETGETKHFKGQLFNEAVFNESVKEFLNLKNKLSDYFDEKNEEDIFDYIPSQKNNQIFTPKAVVKHMVDDLETNNSGIFDDPNKTFADLYMKSGLYITEIVKRLYRSSKMKELYPDNHNRLKHIMEKQVYGLAPTKIIYAIATNYIFGFDKSGNGDISRANFKQIDAAEYAKNGTLQEMIEKEFG